MNKEVESRSHRRRMVLMLMASAFLIWQVPAMDFFANVTKETENIRGLLSAAGFLVWAGGLLFLLASGRAAAKRASPDVMSALEDELVQSNRSKSFVVGYIVTLLTSGIIFVFNLITPLTGLDAAHLILVMAVVSPVFAFVFLERPRA